MSVVLLYSIAVLVFGCAQAQSESSGGTRTLTPIEDIAEWHPQVPFSGKRVVDVGSEGLVVTDPIYLADVYNPGNDDVAKWLWSNAVVASDPGGDVSVPIWWCDPYIVMPIGTHVAAEGNKVLAAEVGCDSGSFAFFAMPSTAIAQIRERVEQEIASRNAVRVIVKPGMYQVFYEDTADGRSIVLAPVTKHGQ